MQNLHDSGNGGFVGVGYKTMRRIEKSALNNFKKHMLELERKMESSGLEVQEFDEKPDVDSIKHEFNEARANLSFWMDKAEQARECRFNEWAGKG